MNDMLSPVASYPSIVLSVCIPTYNRSRGLANLFGNLAALRQAHGDAFEICVSNNASTDGTAELIADWQERLEMRVQHQDCNVGATLNMAAVTRLCRGRWTVLIGDDDAFEPAGFAALLAFLPTVSQDDWVLAGVNGATGEEQVLGDLPTGSHDKARFRRMMLGTSLYTYGFMGMHVFPAAARPNLQALTLEQGQPWPHIATFLRQLERGHVHVFRPAIMVQAVGGAQLFWNAADMAQVTLSKLRILEATSADVPQQRLFHRLLMLRELYSKENAVLLLAWKIYESGSFNKSAPAAYARGWRRIGALLPLALPHIAFVTLLYLTPHAVLRGLLSLVGRGHYVARYEERKTRLKDYNGIKRGI
jgi:glycosyltransferase involved in cell wall biosynthesis